MIEWRLTVSICPQYTLPTTHVVRGDAGEQYLFFSSAMQSSSTNITSISSVHIASPNSSLWVAVLPNQPHPQNTPKTKTERSSRSIWSNPPGPVLLETSSWRPSVQEQASLLLAAAPTSPTSWASRCRPWNGRTKDRHHPLSNRIWHSLTSSAMGYPSTGHPAGIIYPRYTYYTPQSIRTRTFSSTTVFL